MAGFGGFGPAQGIIATAVVDNGTPVAGGTANGVLYVNSSGNLDSGSVLSFNGTNLSMASGQILLPDGTAAAPALAFVGDTSDGFFYGGGLPQMSAGGAVKMAWGSTIRVDASAGFGWGSSGIGSPDVILNRDAAGILAQRNGTNAQVFRVYGTYTDASNNEYMFVQRSGTNFELGTTKSGTGTHRPLRIYTNSTVNLDLGTNGAFQWRVDGTTGHLFAITDNANDIGATGATRPRALFLAQPSITVGSGTGVTVNDTGSVRRVTYKVTVTYQALSAAATTADKTIATLPAKTRVIAIYADTTTKYIGGAVSACALIVGTTVGGAELIATHDVFTAAITRGLVDADMGSLMTRAAAIQGGTMPSFTATNIVTVRITTTTANTDQLTQGSTTYYIETEQLP